jgi:putative hydrolase
MQTDVLLREDHHVHSTFSDGRSTLDENVAEAEQIGLGRLGCVDHVRTDTTYLPDYAAAVRALRLRTAVTLGIGIEAKILDADGRLDMPTSGLDVIDVIYAADHQFPWRGGPRSPREVKADLENGASPAHCIEALVVATMAAMRRNRTHPLVLAHMFSILPKVGLSEEQVPDGLLAELASAAADTGTIVEISERWRCPSLRTLRAVRAAGAGIVCSTDSHVATGIGRYDYVRATLEGLAR